VDDFVQRIQELAQEAVTGQSKYSASELLELARFRIASKAPPRVSSNKLNPFNIFQQEMKRDQNLQLRTGRPAPGTAGINKGRPVFTGNYLPKRSGGEVQAPSSRISAPSQGAERSATGQG
jgi:hypothetical protein